MNKYMYMGAGLVVVLVIVGALVVLHPWSDDDEEEETPDVMLKVNGEEYAWKDLEDLGTKTVSDSTGVSLSAIIDHTGLSDPGSHQYQLLASDGYYKNVTWDNMEEGIIVEVVEGKDTSLKSVFSSLPKRYSVREMVEIKVVETATLKVGNREYTWEQPFDTMFDAVTIGEYEGIRLSDLVNHTGLADPADHNYTLLASDGYSKTVNWTSMMTGVLVSEDHKTAFEALPSAYNVKDLIEIEVVPIT
jgi:hypothetical protein